MKPREREALFRQMRRYGVTSYTEGDVSVTFGDISAPPVARETQEEADMDLPDGVVDPRRKLAEIYRRGKKAA